MQSSRRRGLLSWTLAQVTPLWASAFFFTSYPGGQEGVTVFLWCFVCFRFQFIGAPCKSTLCAGCSCSTPRSVCCPSTSRFDCGALIMLTTFFTVLGPSGVMTQSNAMSAKGLFFFLKSPLPALGELLPFPGNPGVGVGEGMRMTVLQPRCQAGPPP